MQPVKEELERMVKLGVISRVREPTEWCAGMVVVKKPNNKVRICVDLTHLNKSVRRERHPLPAVEQSGSTCRCQGFLHSGREFRVLADPSGQTERTSDNFHHV